MADYKHIIPFIKNAEGGMSDSKYDSAKKFPSPCIYKGRKGWHTNKGITWATFTENAKNLGYEANCENFINMPDSIWYKIFKKAYWDKFNLDNYKSQVIADFVVSLSWGSGCGGAISVLKKFFKEKYGLELKNSEDLRKFINEIVEKEKSDEKLFNELVERKKEFLISLNQPANIKGWLSRLNKFVLYETNFIVRNQKIFIIAGAITLFIGGIMAIIFSQTK